MYSTVCEMFLTLYISDSGTVIVVLDTSYNVEPPSYLWQS